MRAKMLKTWAGTGLTLQYERYKSTTGFEAGIFTGGVRIPLK